MAMKKKNATAAKSPSLPKNLPSDPGKFWRMPVSAASLVPLDGVDQMPALQRLGPLPFSGTGFPLMGFLATLYEHVSTYARDALMDPNKPIE